MDVLVGRRPPGLRDYRARWGETLPRRVDARARGRDAARGARWTTPRPASTCRGRLRSAARTPATAAIDADEARRLLGGR